MMLSNVVFENAQLSITNRWPMKQNERGSFTCAALNGE